MSGILYGAVSVHRSGMVQDKATHSLLAQPIFSSALCVNFIKDVGAPGKGSIDGNGEVKLRNGQRVRIRYHVQQSHKSHDIYHICATNRDAKYSFAYGFLEDLNNAPIASTDIQKVLNTWNMNPPLSKMDKLKGQLESLKSVLNRNLTAMAERGETLSKLEEQSEHVSESAGRFNEGARQAEQKMCWRKWKWQLIIGGSLAFLITLIIIIAVASSGNRRRRRMLRALADGDFAGVFASSSSDDLMLEDLD